MKFLDLYYKSQLYTFTNLNLLILTFWYQEENLTDSDLIKQNITFLKKSLIGNFTKIILIKD